MMERLHGHTVTVSSPHGTGDEIDFKDQLRVMQKVQVVRLNQIPLSVKKKQIQHDGINDTSENYLKVSVMNCLKRIPLQCLENCQRLMLVNLMKLRIEGRRKWIYRKQFYSKWKKNTAYAKVTEKVKDEHSSEPTIFMVFLI